MCACFTGPAESGKEFSYLQAPVCQHCHSQLPFKMYRAILKTSRGLFQSIQLYQSNKMLTLELSAYVSEIPNDAHTTRSQNLWTRIGTKQ